MTWNPLPRKNYLSKRPTPAQPLLTQSEDRELDIAVQRLMHVEDTIRKLRKEAKRYIEAISNLDKADQRLSSDLSTCGLAHMNDDFRITVENYHSITTQIGRTVHDLTPLLSETFVEPLKKLLSKFVIVAEAIERRETLVHAWEYSYERVKKLQDKQDKSASHVAKLERERRSEERAAKELRDVHSRLLVELPWFLQKRLDYIKPSIHALIMIQLNYYGHAMELYTSLMPANENSDALSSGGTRNSSPGSTNMNEEHFQSSVTSQINRIRSLTIVKDH
ncbi:bridging integrator 3 homolog [Venturia canescens]|uniref:bridging integrator 3 homolog n=1 Tax=Venturia canescens TaxID=32260 RepID=UPI001C9C9842|nr:bridging integrator 3 homolog [Venturia canescens]